MTFKHSTFICSTGEKISTEVKNRQGQVFISEQRNLMFHIENSEKKISVIFADHTTDSVLVLSVAEALFQQYPEVETLDFHHAQKALQNYLTSSIQDTEIFSLNRKVFFQIPLLWHYENDLRLLPEQWTETDGIKHPLRPIVPANQRLYRRYLPKIQKTITIRSVHPDKDLEIFHDWQNQERVAQFWELNKGKEELKEYLVKGLNDPHQLPTFIEFDDVPVGYWEMYWVKEDRLGPYYDSEAYDRGFHLLVGNTNYLGFDNTDSILKSVCHYLFLDEPRTRKIMAEPRSDNKNILRYLETFRAWKKLKEFDFPHKRAALLECRREAFFEGNYL